MATTLPRHQITEIPEIAQAIDKGVAHWPEKTRAQVARDLIQVGANALEQQTTAQVLRRTQAWEALAAQFSDSRTQHSLAELQEEWPA